MNQKNILDYPLGVFRFKVDFFRSIENAGAGDQQPVPLCGGAFSECSGLDATMAVKTIKAGGVNYGEIHRAGRTSFATVILKRGVSKNRDLWNWFHLVASGGFAYRLDVRITQLDMDPYRSGSPAQNQTGDRSGGAPEPRPVMVWNMKSALPVKFKTADYNAGFTQVAIEELHFVHQGLTHSPA